MSKLIEFLKNSPRPETGPKLEVGDSLSHSTVNGRIFNTITKVDGTVIKTDDTENQKWFDLRCQLIEDEFSNLPFTVCLDDDELLELDEPFTDEPVIFIRDNRASEHSYMWHDIDELERNRYNSNFRVKRQGDKPITLRQIINEMGRVAEYKLINEAGEEHRFFEGLEKRSPIQYLAFFGS